MTLPPMYLYAAGVLVVLVASANLFAFSKFRYLFHLKKVPLIVAQVFLVQNFYIMLLQAGLGLLCFFFAGELTSGQPLARALTGFFAIFWGSRVALQFFYYDREIRRANRGFDLLFILADCYLAVIFALTAFLPIHAE